MQSGFCGRDNRRPWLILAASAGTAICLPQATRAEAAAVQPQQAPDAAAPFSSILSHIELGVGSSAWSGDFGAPKTTTIAAVLATAVYRVDGLRLTASVPWMRIDSPGAVFTGVEGTPIIANPGATGGRRLRQGIGDLTLGASYLLPSNFTEGFDTDLSFRVKAPTASKSSDLSTGEVDYSFGATVSRSLGRFIPIASVFYRHFGDGPEFQLKDGVATTVGASYAFSPKAFGMLTYDYSQRASRYISDAHQISASLTAPLLSTPLRVTSFVAGGLSRGAPAVSVGLAFSVNL